MYIWSQILSEPQCPVNRPENINENTGLAQVEISQIWLHSF